MGCVSSHKYEIVPVITENNEDFPDNRKQVIM
jgi:hypothetical protein